MKPGTQFTVDTPVLSHDERLALVVPGDRLWVVEVRGDRMRVRCPETSFDGWMNTADPRVVPPAGDTE